jgi:hypothetical protein
MRSLRSMDILILLSREEAPSMEARAFRVECGTRGRRRQCASWSDPAGYQGGALLEALVSIDEQEFITEAEKS